MNQEPMNVRKEAIDKLLRYGIDGSMVYLIDVIPLIEMMWADGSAQDSEVAILEEYLRKHVNHINKIAGHNAISMRDARSFVSRFIHTRPDPELLKELRSLIVPVRLSTSNDALNDALRESLLSACLDIASSAACQYPHTLQERFNPDEKRCFFEILDTLTT